MAKTKEWAMDEADTTIDYAIQEVRNGFDRDKAIEILMRNDNVMNFYSQDDLEMIFEFELSDAVRNYDEQLKQTNVDELYVSFDIDALDEKFASATGTPEGNGMTPDECLTILRALSTQFPITGADMMEIAPFTDSSLVGQASSETTLREGAKISAFLIEAMNTA